MNHVNMAGLNAGVGPVGGMAMMNNGMNGVGSRAGSDQDDYEQRLNTFIYDYFLKNEHYDCARSILRSGMPLNVSNNKISPGRRRDGDMNGVDENSMDADTKDELDSKRPDDLPPAEQPSLNEGSSFLLEWFCLFWDIFHAQRKNHRASSSALSYVQHTQQQSRLRQEQQQRWLQNIPPQMMNNYMRAGPMNGMMNTNDVRKAALNRNVTPQQMQMARNQQQFMQNQQMQREGSDVDINGQRPRTPTSGDNAPSPSKRPRLENGPFNGQTAMPNGRPPGMQNPALMNNSKTRADTILIQNGIDPSSLSPSQFQSFQQQNPAVQAKSIQVYAQNLNQYHQRSNPGMNAMPNQGSPLMQGGLDVSSNMQSFPYESPIIRGVPGPGAGGNHALQDYQMQLMLLEQQNKKRLLMARQEADNTSLRPDGQHAMAGQPGFPPGMSPQGSRSGPSPNPSDQMKRGTPRLSQTGLPGSPMPDGSVPQGRNSPAVPIQFNQMPHEFIAHMKSISGDAMGGPVANGNVMRPPPSSHPQFNLTPAGAEAMRQAQLQQGRMANGNWQQGPQVPQGQASMMPQMPQAQQPAQLGTPQQRSAAMPPPQAPPTGTAVNGRPNSPTQTTAPPTPQQGSKPNPKAKKDGKETRKRPTKKASTANLGTAGTPATDAENPLPTPTPSTPITPQHPNSFTKNATAQNQPANVQPVTSAAAATAPIVPQVPEPNGLQFPGMQTGDIDGFNMNFGDFQTNDVLESFDFDSFLQDGDQDINFDSATMAFGDGVEASTGES